MLLRLVLCGGNLDVSPSAPRRFLFVISALAASLLLPLPTADAGTYIWTTIDAKGNVTAQSPTYSGDTFLNQGAKDPDIEDYTIGSDGTYGAGGGNTADYADDAPAEITCFGTITATFTWQLDYPGELPPICAIVEQQSSAGAGCDGVGTGSYDDGLGHSGSVDEPGSNGSDGTLCSAKTSPGATFTVECSPSADSGPAYADVFASVSYSAVAFPVVIDLGGPVAGANNKLILDANGNPQILIGQPCGASLSGIPDECVPSDYNWNIEGATFQSWSPTTPATEEKAADPQASHYVDGPGVLTEPSAFWYWNELHETSKLVSCSVTVTPPPGQGVAFTVSASQGVHVYVPIWQVTGSGGYVKVGLYKPGNASSEFFAGPTTTQVAANNGQTGGMNIAAKVTSPDAALFSDGTLDLCQIVTPDMECLDFGNSLYVLDNNGERGLDGVYPYGWNKPAPNY